MYKTSFQYGFIFEKTQYKNFEIIKSHCNCLIALIKS